MKDRQEKVAGPTNGFYSAGLSQPPMPMVAVAQPGGQTKAEVVKEKDEKKYFS